MASNTNKQTIEVTKEAHKILSLVKIDNESVKTLSDAVIYLHKNRSK